MIILSPSAFIRLTTTILDFERGADIIDFYAIANGLPLQFVGTSGFTAGGVAEVATAEIGGVLTVVSLDADGNGTADLELIVYGAIDMDRADFGL